MTQQRAPQQRAVLVTAILAAFVVFLDGSVVNVALPAIDEEFGGGVGLQQWVVDGYLLTLSSLILLAGSLSDLFGRTRVLRWGLVGFGTTSLLCALAPTGEVLIAARALQGVAGALLVPSALALITSRFRGEAQGAAIGTWTAWTSVANVIGPLLGGALTDTIGWRWVFGVNVLPIAVTLVMLSRVQPDAAIADRPRIDWVGAILAAFGLAGTVFALIEQSRFGWTSPLIAGSAAVGVGCLTAFVLWESRHPAPLVPLAIFRSRNFSAGNVATLFIYGALAFGLFIVPIFVQQVGGLSALQSGLLTVPVTVILILLSTAAGRMSARLGPRLFMTVGPIIAGGGFLLMLTITDPVDVWLQILPGMLVFGVGLALTVAPLTAAILGALPAERSGIASAVNNAVSRVGGLVTVALAGVVTGGTVDVPGTQRAVLVTGLLLVIGGVVSFAGIRSPAHPRADPSIADAPAA